MNHREQFWRWLIFGFRRLILMVEDHAREVEPLPDQLDALEGYARRLLEIVKSGRERAKA